MLMENCMIFHIHEKSIKNYILGKILFCFFILHFRIKFSHQIKIACRKKNFKISVPRF
eukprot:UN10395